MIERAMIFKYIPHFAIISLILIFALEEKRALAKVGIDYLTKYSSGKANEIVLNENRSLEQKAQQLYQTGKFRETIPLLQEIINNYIAEEDIIGVAIARQNLALVYQQLGKWQEANQAISDAIDLLPQIKEPRDRKKILADILNVRGQIELSLGQSQKALETSTQAITIEREVGDLLGFTRSKIYQAQALQALGLYAKAIKNLTDIQQQLEKQPDSLLKSKALLSLGDILRRVGKYQESQLALKQSLAIAEKLNSQEAIADILLKLGDTARLQEKEEIALDFYQRAIQTSFLPEIKIQAQLQQISILIARKEWSQVKDLVSEIEHKLNQLSPSQIAIHQWINLARNLIKMEKVQKEKDTWPIANYLTKASQMASSLGDKRSESEAIGNLGTWYEQNQNLDRAEKLTDKALLIAQAINAPDFAYQWQWQLGRILQAKGQQKEAIAAYTQSVTTLQSLRGDLVAISSQVQYSFRENVEPVYRELVGLLLQPNASQDNLQQARSVIESLQLAELDNFFRDACLDAKPVKIDRLDPTAAVIYTIILPDRLEVIAALPNQPLRHYATHLTQEKIEQNLFFATSTIRSPNRAIELQPLEKLYNWLIRPLETDLAANEIKTLVFVQDGALRNVPPSILYDGEKYLVEKYNVALAPSLELVKSQTLLTSKKSELLIGAIAQSRQGFIALPGVESEINSIESEFSTNILLNNAFTEANFDKAIEESPAQIIHLATHGQFSSKAEDTFILTWDDRININELNNLLRGDRTQIQPIELLVLSACETATGDNRAALGLAGIAVRAGARSTIATLWDVRDRSTALLMSSFYQELAQNHLTKAEALRQAQEKLLRNKNFSHPYYWSAFVLIGNWI
jgi:CHAT domain-containing protein